MNRLTDDELLANAGRCAPEVIDWAEREGLANMRAHVDTAGAINTQASALLTLLIGGVGGALGLAVKLAEPGAGPISWGAGAACVWWAGVAVYLNARNLHLQDAPMVNNQPNNLLLPSATIDQLRRGELVNLELRIRQQRDTNAVRADALNRARLLALAGPLAFAAGAFLCYLA